MVLIESLLLIICMNFLLIGAQNKTMTLRFQKRIKIFPFIYLNISKKGISLSFGRQGGSINVSKAGIKDTAGLPGTGVSYSKRLASFKPKAVKTAKRLK